MDKAKAQNEIQALVNRFVSRQSDYETPDYLERQLQNDFLNKLFKNLGWDVDNEKNLSTREREVLVEKGDTKGRPDYSFRLNGEGVLFVEAKAASQGTENKEFIFQAKMYGWNSQNVNVTILTDFKTFKVFDSSLKPDINKQGIGLIFELKCEDYAKSGFEKLWTFSKEEVENGSLEKLFSKDAQSKRLR
ncbi:MAG: type I restriction enzyme HsdR N-terminal domain-containing protein, partial [Candidatus Diapherotrites archaeon]